MSNIDTTQQISLLQDGLESAIATLYAIDAAGLFRSLPVEPGGVAEHNHGCWLLDMLARHLTRIQQQVDALGAANAVEG